MHLDGAYERVHRYGPESGGDDQPRPDGGGTARKSCGNPPAFGGRRAADMSRAQQSAHAPDDRAYRCMAPSDLQDELAPDADRN